ncbi:RHE_PE00001 family protein [Mesorhizobium sp. M1409]
MPAAGQKRRDGEGAGTASMEADDRDDAEADRLAEEFAEIDAVLARSSRILSGAGVPAKAARPDDRPEPQNGLIYDLDWNEEERLAEWQAVLADTREWPSVLRATILLEAWSDIEVLQHATWLGPLLVAALLRQEGLAAHHLACIHLGAKNIPRERRRARNRGDRLLAWLDAIHDAALAGLKEHDRLVLAKSQMERRLKQRRASSKLPDLVELVLSRPLVSAGMIQERLKVTKQGALNLIGELGLREMTGRGRFRAWGIV